MIGPVPLLLTYVFMAWAGTTKPKIAKTLTLAVDPTGFSTADACLYITTFLRTKMFHLTSLPTL
jgi:hypothetical protein